MDSPVVLDVVGLYGNIPQEEGEKAFEEKIKDKDFRPDQRVPTLLLMTLLHYFLTFNVFIFNGIMYVQEWGTATGTRVAPTFANIFMGSLEEKLLRLWQGIKPHWWRRFIDDCLFFWRGSEHELVDFLTYMNTSHSTIKFTAEWRTNGEIKTAKWCAITSTVIVKMEGRNEEQIC